MGVDLQAIKKILQTSGEPDQGEKSKETTEPEEVVVLPAQGEHRDNVTSIEIIIHNSDVTKEPPTKKHKKKSKTNVIIPSPTPLSSFPPQEPSKEQPTGPSLQEFTDNLMNDTTSTHSQAVLEENPEKQADKGKQIDVEQPAMGTLLWFTL